MAQRLSILYYVFNFSEDFKIQAIDWFISTYECGETPNPCINRNRYLKFDRFFQWAEELGFDTSTTGYYAKIEMQDGWYILKKALDRSKDQSYVLYPLIQEQLAHIRFLLDGLSKVEVRSVAEAQGFYNAEKPNSQPRYILIKTGKSNFHLIAATGCHSRVGGRIV